MFVVGGFSFEAKQSKLHRYQGDSVSSVDVDSDTAESCFDVSECHFYSVILSPFPFDIAF